MGCHCRCAMRMLPWRSREVPANVPFGWKLGHRCKKSWYHCVRGLHTIYEALKLMLGSTLTFVLGGRSCSEWPRAGPRAGPAADSFPCHQRQPHGRRTKDSLRSTAEIVKLSCTTTTGTCILTAAMQTRSAAGVHSHHHACKKTEPQRQHTSHHAQLQR